MTMTYRRDAGVYHPYSQSFRRLTNSDIDKLVAGKNKLAIWIASNKRMRGAQERLALSNRLVKAGLKLVRRGRIFPKVSIPESRTSDSFFKMIREYKFYMSFENQWHCKDYITEKVWKNAFTAGTVPVVWGATKQDYKANLPPGSFIFAPEYTAQELTDYLNYLDKNDTAYREYFHWRTMDPESFPNGHRTTNHCHLCRILHGINLDNIFSPLYGKDENFTSIPLFTDYIVKREIPSLYHTVYETDNPSCH